jgi:hypothetical protein
MGAVGHGLWIFVRTRNGLVNAVLIQTTSSIASQRKQAM